MKRRLLLLFLLSVLAVGCSQQKADEPRQLVTVYPRYPEYAAANYIKGLVEVKFDIGADGTVTRIVFLRSEPHNLCKRLVRTVLIFTESSDQLSRATDRVP
ncbi:TonB family protein, partial [Escherichia coli]|uniref:TonB family protein n=1 Tax=Escherichia coli TaxID=562 RepID=UPI0020B222FC